MSIVLGHDVLNMYFGIVDIDFMCTVQIFMNLTKYIANSFLARFRSNPDRKHVRELFITNHLRFDSVDNHISGI